MIVYDYINSYIQVFDNMYVKRLRTYKRTGFELITNRVLEKQTANAIYDSGSYMDVFEQDIVECEKQMIISSLEINQGQGRTVPISCKNKAGSRLQGYGYNDRTGEYCLWQSRVLSGTC